MRKLVTGLFALLIGWNVVLTVQLANVNQNNNTTEQGKVNQVVSNVVSDMSEIVAEVEDSVVGISSFQNGNGLGTGSGVVYQVNQDQMYIVTNHHVIAGASEVVVKFNNGNEVDAQIIGSDELTDLAVLSLESDEDVKPFTIGDSSMIKKGESVMAIGSPLGLDFQGSVTSGIISGTDRLVSVDVNNDGIEDWDALVLQTDAAINPGNSGGALVNMAGELIGINSMKIASSQVEGMGFAIPSNEMVKIVDSLIENGKVVRPLLGISSREISELSAFERARLGLDPSIENGLYVVEVSTDSGAADAGIQAKDIIVSFDGEEITSFKAFRQMLYAKAVGDQVELEVYRDGQMKNMKVTLK